MTTCRHTELVCENTTPTGTPARCRVCGASIIIPPVRYNGQTKTLAGLGLSAKERMAWDVDLFHAEALVAESKRGYRE